MLIRIKSNGEEGGRPQVFPVSNHCQLPQTATTNKSLDTYLGWEWLPVAVGDAQPSPAQAKACSLPFMQVRLPRKGEAVCKSLKLQPRSLLS